ncbi:MAG: hypothetical protein IJF73_04895 [Clostridia bacterium]|nr:hypothetical protein [Clostridia bacterium]
MRPIAFLSAYYAAFSPRALRLLLLGLAPLYAALAFLVTLAAGGTLFGYDALWLSTHAAFWVDSFGVSLLLLLLGAGILDYAEKHDEKT